MNSTSRKIQLILIFLLLLYCFVSIFTTQSWGDEKKYHYPNAKDISLKQIINLNSSYSSAYGPLPYLIGGFFLKIYDSLYILRLLNYFVTIIMIFFIYKICVKLCKEPISITLLLISNPYLLRSAFTYYMFNYGMLFAISGIYYYYFSNSRYKSLVSHFFYGLAVLSQQWMLVVVFSIFITDLIKSSGNSTRLADTLKSLSIKIVFLLPALILFFQWKGLTHPNFQSHSLYPGFEHLTGALANWGVAIALIIIFNYKAILRITFLPVVFILPLLYLSIPKHSTGHGINVITGVAAQIATQLQRQIFFPYQLSMFLFSIFGLSAILLIVNKTKTTFDIFLEYTLLGFLTAFIASTRLSASHIFVSVPFLFLIFYKEINANTLLKYALICQFYFLSFFYIIFYSFFVAKGFGW